jgi:hypothetical protein
VKNRLFGLYIRGLTDAQLAELLTVSALLFEASCHRRRKGYKSQDGTRYRNHMADIAHELRERSRGRVA